MAGVDRILQLKLVTDVASMASDLKKTESRVKKLGRTVKQQGTILGGLAAPMIFDFLKGGVDDALAFTGVLGGLESATKGIGEDWGTVGTKITDAVDSAELLNFDDVGAGQVLQGLITQLGDVDTAIRIFALAQDIARNKGISLEAATKLATGAFNGQKGALKKLGLPTDLKGIEAIEAAEGKVGTAAEDATTTAKGKWASFQTFMDNLAQGFGDVFLTALGPVQEFVSTQLPAAFTTLQTAVQPALDILSTFWRDTLEPMIADLNKNGAVTNAALAGIAAGIAVVGVAAGISILTLSPWLIAILAIVAAVGLLVLAWETDFLGIKTNVEPILKSLQDMITWIGNLKTKIDEVFPGWIDVLAKVAGHLLDIGIFLLTLPIQFAILGTKIAGWAADVASDIWDGIVDGLKGLAGAIAKPIKDGLNAIISVWNGLGVHIPEIVLFDALGRRDTFGPINLELPNIPLLARGGIVTGPTLAMIGEKGPEAVIPLGSGYGATTINVTIQTGVGDPVAIGREVDRVLRIYRKRAGIAPVLA